MKLNILLAFAIILTLFLKINGQSTELTYIVERETDQEDHYVELTLKIQVDGTSLKQSIDSAANVISDIKKAVIDDCQSSAVDKKAKKECKDVVQDAKFQVEPKYHLVRKIPTFTLFILTHEVTIKIKNIKGLGKIIDQIQQIGQDFATLKEFVWKTDKETDPEISTLKDGLKQGKQLCKKIGKTLDEVISVEQLEKKEKEDEQQQQKDQDIMEQQVQTTVFKFKVKCSPKKSKSQGKKNE